MMAFLSNWFAQGNNCVSFLICGFFHFIAFLQLLWLGYHISFWILFGLILICVINRFNVLSTSLFVMLFMGLGVFF